MFQLRLTNAAENDIVDLLAWSEQQFGNEARLRYERLIVAALADIAHDPARPGSTGRPDLGQGARTWHLRASRDRPGRTAGVVHRPRHFLLYRPVDAGSLLVGRVLHDAMDPVLHDPDSADWSSSSFPDQP